MVSTRSRRGRPLPRSSHGKRYRPNDNCKRHRLKDRKPKTEVVSGYRRRK